MTKTSLKGLLGTAAILAAIAATPSAHAATCWWAGGDWNCKTAPPPGAVIAPPSGGSLAGFPYGGVSATQASFIPAPSWGFSRADYQVFYNANPNRK